MHTSSFRLCENTINQQNTYGGEGLQKGNNSTVNKDRQTV